MVYQMRCLGGAIPSTNTPAISLSWMDGGASVQAATSLAYVASDFITTAFPNTITVTISNKRFRSLGGKSLYSFAVTTNVALNSKTIYYFDFHMILSSYLDNQGSV